MFEKININKDWKPYSILPKNLGSTHIWLVHFPAFQTDKFKNYLSDGEKEKASRFRFAKDKKAFVTCRSVLRFLLGHYLDVSPEELIFSYNDYGKPFLDSSFYDQIFFNVSHSGEFGLLAFDKYLQVGIDLEKIGSFDILSLSESVFSFPERNELLLKEKGLQTKAFYCGWTRKESFIKAIGSGLSFPLKDFSISIDPSIKSCQVEFLSKDHRDIKKWEILDLEFHSNYCAAIALNKITGNKVKKFIFQNS